MRLAALTFALTAALSAALPAQADWKPSGPVKLEIGFGPGGETDTMGRAIAAEMEKQTGWDVIAENKPGGGGVAMFTGVGAAAPDGLTVGMGVSMPVLINLVLRGDKLPFKLDSFDYLATVTRAQVAIVARADAPFDDLAGLVAWSKANGGAPVAFDAKPQELILRAVNKQDDAGIRPVSSKSSAEMIQNLLGEHVVASFAAGAHIEYLKTGALKMLASATGDRHAYAPDTRTLREQGYDLAVDPWFYFAAPAGLPADAKAALAGALDAAITSDTVRKLVANAFHADVDNRGPAGTAKMMQDGIGSVTVLFGQ
ncbi:tripartite tricarboxylate transporter substrate binding protein [Thalassobaculum sp.]|uniref:tripartite tricarboxylate transporter substrate binding protein n=1 Tax=Thalassobaculum sp. TaxID=2022740 RepID=UPI0032EE0BC8